MGFELSEGSGAREHICPLLVSGAPQVPPRAMNPAQELPDDTAVPAVQPGRPCAKDTPNPAHTLTPCEITLVITNLVSAWQHT